MFAIYQRTVRPMTAITTIMTLYSNGYYSGVKSWQDQKSVTFVELTIDLTNSFIVGSCVGITYPVSIPMLVAYEYIHYGW